jgi:hypothetical protein
MPTATKLTDISLEEISGVDEAANRYKGWMIAKSKEPAPETVEEVMEKATEFAKDHQALMTALEQAVSYLAQAPAEVQQAAQTLYSWLASNNANPQAQQPAPPAPPQHNQPPPPPPQQPQSGGGGGASAFPLHKDADSTEEVVKAMDPANLAKLEKLELFLEEARLAAGANADPIIGQAERALEEVITAEGGTPSLKSAGMATTLKRIFHSIIGDTPQINKQQKVDFDVKSFVSDLVSKEDS